VVEDLVLGDFPYGKKQREKHPSPKNQYKLVGGFNPFETYESNWESSPKFGVKIKNI